MSLKSSTQENEATKITEKGYWDQFGAVRTINNTIGGTPQSRDSMTMSKSDMT